jgi:putative transposase
MKREQVRLTVRRASLKHYKREYGHADLHAFNGQVVILEYDLMDDRVAVIRALDSKWICDANLIKSIDVIVPNRLEEKRLLRKETAIKRLQKKIDEQIGRGALLIDAEAIAQGALEGDYTRIEELEEPINLLDFD